MSATTPDGSAQLREVMVVMQQGKPINESKGTHHLTDKDDVTSWVASELGPCLEQALPVLGSAQEATNIKVRVVCSPFPVAYDTADFVAAELASRLRKACARGQQGPRVTYNVEVSGHIDAVDNALCDVFSPEGLTCGGYVDFSEEGVAALTRKLDENCGKVKVHKRVAKHAGRPKWGEDPSDAAQRFMDATVGQLRTASNHDTEAHVVAVTIAVAHAATVAAASNAVCNGSMTRCRELGFVVLARDAQGDVRRLDELCRGVEMTAAATTAVTDTEEVNDGPATVTFAADTSEAAAADGAPTPVDPSGVSPPKQEWLTNLRSLVNTNDPRNAAAGVCVTIAVVVFVAWLLFGRDTGSLIEAPAANVRHLSDDLDGVVNRVVYNVRGDATPDSVLHRILGGLLL